MRNRVILLLLVGVPFISMALVHGAEAGSLSPDEQLIRVGAGAFRDGLYDIAETEFVQLVRDYPSHAKLYDVYYLLGRTSVALGKWNGARSAFSKIVTANKSFADMEYALFWLAQSETHLGNSEEAKRILLTLTKKYPSFDWSDYAYYLLGMLEFSSHRLTPAEASFKWVLSYSKRPELVRLSSLWIGILQSRKKEFDAAIRHLQSFGDDPRGVPEGYVQIALFWLAETQVKAGRFQDAMDNYRIYSDRFKEDPFLPAVLWRLGFCEYRLGMNREAADLFHAFASQYKDSRFLPFTQYLLGEIHLAEGDFTSSISAFGSILNSSQAESLWGAALVSQYWGYFHLGSLDEANKVLQRLAKVGALDEERAFLQWLNAESAFSEGRVADSLPYYFQIMNTRFRERALFQIGRAYFCGGQFREAVTNVDILTLEFPASPYRDEALFIRGESYLQLGNADQALEAFDLMTRRNRTFPWGLLALTETGSIYLHRSEDAQAEKAFRLIIREFPNHPLFYYAAFQLGNVQLKKANLPEAISLYSLVLKGNAFNLLGEVYFQFGEIFYRQANYENALRSFQTAMRYFEENSIGFFLAQLEIGNLQRRWDRMDEAKRSYQHILDHSHDEDIRNAANELLMRIKP